MEHQFIRNDNFPYYKSAALNNPVIPLRMEIRQESPSIVGSSSEPEIFGPALWFTLHNCATTYPSRPTGYVQSGMKSIITNLPLLLPCLSCKEHCFNYIATQDLNKAVSCREELFSFFVNLHNYVNKWLRKSLITLQDAKIKYGFDNYGKGSLVKITYT